MYCDPEDDKFMVFLGVTYKDDERSEGYENLVLLDLDKADLPEDYKNFEYLKNLKKNNVCTLSNGDVFELKAYGKDIIGGMYGYKGFMTLKRNNDFIYYKKIWDHGGGYDLYDPYVVFYSNSKLHACKKIKEKAENKKIVIKSACEDVSERLSGDLKGRELLEYNLNNNNETIVKGADEKICQDHLKKEIKGVNWEHKVAQFEQNGSIFQGDSIYKDQIDINNDGKEEVVYNQFTYDKTSNANYLVYFLNQHDATYFEDCMITQKCPENFDHSSDNRYSFYVTRSKKDFPKSFPIYAGLLDIKQNWKRSYNHVHVQFLDYDGQVYLYFNPNQKRRRPYRAIAKVNPENELETICLFGYGEQ